MTDNKPPVEESSEYDNFLGEFAEDEAPNTLEDFIGSTEDTKEWKEHWKEMPEFVQEDNPTYKKLIVSFRNKEDYEEFAKLIDQPLTEKTKTIWHPRLDRTANSLYRWIEEDSE